MILISQIYINHSIKLKSEDRGETISAGAFPYCPFYLERTFILNKDSLCFSNVVGNDGIFFSFDGGMTWVEKDRSNVITGSNELWPKRILYFNEHLHGFISENDGTLYKTVNAGDSWHQIPIVESTGLNDLIFVNNQEGFLVGKSGLMITTVDGGSTWHQENSGTTHSLNGIDFNNEHIIAVGDSGIIVKRLRNLLVELNVSSESNESSIVFQGGTLQLQASPLPENTINSSVKLVD